MEYLRRTEGAWEFDVPMLHGEKAQRNAKWLYFNGGR